MRTKNIATVSAVMFGLTAALMGGTALSQTTSQDPAQDPAQQPIQGEGQMDTQAQGDTGTQTEGDATTPDTGVAEDADPAAPETGVAEDSDTMTPDTGVAEDADPAAPETGVAEDADPLETETGTGTGMASDEGMPRRSVTDSAEPYAGDVLAGITADEMIGMNVIDATGESVGSVTDLLFGSEDQVDHAIIDVGGFLGFGAKSVAIPLDELTVAEGDDEVVLNTTREELDAMSEWTRGDDGWMSN